MSQQHPYRSQQEGKTHTHTLTQLSLASAFFRLVPVAIAAWLGKACPKNQLLGKVGHCFGKDSGRSPVLEKTMAQWGVNKKGRPTGSGTTSMKRKEARKAKQWSFLEKDDPTSKRCLEKHKEALEKALEKASSKLNSLEKEELDAAMDDVADFTGGSTSSAPVLGKAQSTVLGKAQRKGKHGPREVFMRDTSTETELAGGLEKLNLNSKSKPLEKGSKNVKKEDEKLVVLLDWHNTFGKG